MNDPQPSVLASLVSLCSANNSCFQGKKKTQKPPTAEVQPLSKTKQGMTHHIIFQTLFLLQVLCKYSYSNYKKDQRKFQSTQFQSRNNLQKNK